MPKTKAIIWKKVQLFLPNYSFFFKKELKLDYYKLIKIDNIEHYKYRYVIFKDMLNSAKGV